MKESFDEITALIQSIQDQYPDMNYPEVVETAKLIAWNQFFIEVSSLFEGEMVH